MLLFIFAMAFQCTHEGLLDDDDDDDDDDLTWITNLLRCLDHPPLTVLRGLLPVPPASPCCCCCSD